VPPAPAFAGPVDPNGVGALVARLGNSPRKAGKASILVASALLGEDERATNLVQGQVEGRAATAVLTAKRLLIVNDREWSPRVESVDIDPELTVQGWQDGKTASLIFQRPGLSITVERIVDVALAHEMAAAVRGQAAGG
jgi:hypothetical protein